MQNSIILEISHEGKLSPVLIRVLEKRGRFSIHIIDKGRLVWAKLVTLDNIIPNLQKALWNL